MDRLMDSPWFLRITALVLAMLLFFTVKSDSGGDKNAAGNSTEVIRDVPVEAYYDSENLVVTGLPETVDVTVDGPLNLVQTTRALKDFTIFVDLRDYTLGSHTVRIQHENLSEKLQVRLDPNTVNVVIEEKVTQSVRVQPEINERLIGENFVVTDISVEPSTVEITGAKSAIDSIAFVKASVSGEEGITKSFSRNTRVRVLDRDLNKLPVTISPEEVEVTVTIEEYSKELPIEVRERGNPPDGVTINTLIPNVRTVRVYGPRPVVDNLDSVTVDVDVSDIRGSRVVKVDLKAPKGVSRLSRSEIEVSVGATVEETPPEDTDEPTAGLPPGQSPAQTPVSQSPPATEASQPAETEKVFADVPIEVRGLSNQFKGTFIEPEKGLLTVTVRGKPEQVNLLKRTDIQLFVDASGAVEGENLFSVSVDGPEEMDWSLSSNRITLQVERA